MNSKTILAAWLLVGTGIAARAEAVWQWSAPLGSGRAFLWVPEDCQQVRAVVAGQNNMIEQGILEHPNFRREMARLGLAEIFIAPPFDTWQSATNNDAANAQFNALLKSFAADSGYGELELAPIIPLGHSALASYPWNFAAWNPGRTLAILSVHGDAPQTKLVGNGRPNVDWGDRRIDGIPGLMAMGEYEWWEDRLASMTPFRAKFPGTPIALLAEPGRGHFDYSDDLVNFLALFIRKSAEERLPEKIIPGQPPVLKPIDPRTGWLVQRWYLDQPRTFEPAPFAKYAGEKSAAFWAFDRETARAIQNYRANQIGKAPQLLGFVQDGKIVPQTDTHNQISLKFQPDADGLTFHLAATFLDSVDGGSKNVTRWTGLPAGSPIGHATGGAITISRISGPFEKVSADTFRVRFDRVASTTDRRNSDLWLLAEHPGDTKYKSIVQQALLKLPAFNEGAEQHITFENIPDQGAGTKSLKLNASSDSGRPIHFYVREGPAEVDGDTLRFTPIPPRTKFPVRVTVVAWQLGCAGERKLKTAAPVERDFLLKSAIVDRIIFGEAASETNHALTASHSQIITGGLGEPARILLPQADPAWEGGHVAFTLKVDPQKQTYATVRLWGSDATRNQLVLFCEGKQIGYRHLGDIDMLDIGGGEAAFPGRFIYETTPLPLPMTRGKTELHCEIRSYGPTWGYTGEFAKFQKPLEGPTRGIYQLYSHTEGCFIPPTDEKQGAAPANPPVRTEPGAEVMDKLKARVNGEVNRLLKSARPLNEMQMQFLARAYFVKWTPAYQNQTVVTQVIKGLDALFAAYRKNPELAHNDPATPNAEWFEFGPAGQAIALLAEQVKPSLDGLIDGGGKAIPRHTAYSEMLVEARDWHRRHRRLYTNQTMITDMNIYLSNRGLEVVDPASALPEAEVRCYLYQAVGLEPWRDSDPGADSHLWGMGTNYWQLTAKGLTKELGFVGYYGEVLDWVTSIYDAARPAPGLPGDERIKAQLERIAHARTPFRAPGTDADGFRAMRAETIVGWRDSGHYPGDVMYAERSTWDASTLYAVAATLDPEGIGHAQQMFDDHQFFISLKRQMAQANSLRVIAGLLGVPDQYELVKSQPPSAQRLPMTPGQPDFVFSDEEDGVVAVKNGGEILYASLYWRSRNAVNSLARVHLTTPTMDRIAVVQEDTQFTPSGQFYTRPDWTTFGFGNGGPRYPVAMHSAEAGEKLPIAQVPAGVTFKPGDENGYAGKGDFYALRYGNYLIGMNLTTDKTFELKPPADETGAKELVSGKTVNLDAPLKVGPRSTVVLFFGK